MLLQFLDSILRVTSSCIKYINFLNIVRDRQRQIRTHLCLITKTIKILVSGNTIRHFREKRTRVLLFLELSEKSEDDSVLIRIE